MATPLKRKSDWHYDYLPRLAIYRDDVEALHSLLVGRFRKVDLTAMEYELSVPADMDRLGGRPFHRLSLRGSGLGDGYSGWLSINLYPKYAQLVIDDDQSPELLGLQQAARAILQRRLRWTGRLINLSSWALIPAGIVGAIRLAGVWRPEQPLSLVLSSTLFVFGLVLTVAAIWLRITSHTTIYSMPYADRSSWWDRNGESVLAQSAAAIFGGLVVLAITWAFGLLKLG